MCKECKKDSLCFSSSFRTSIVIINVMHKYLIQILLCVTALWLWIQSMHRRVTILPQNKSLRLGIQNMRWSVLMPKYIIVSFFVWLETDWILLPEKIYIYIFFFINLQCKVISYLPESDKLCSGAFTTLNTTIFFVVA